MARATVSACGRPPGWGRPRPGTMPSLTRTQPPAGLGATVPSACRASSSAAPIQRKSPLVVGTLLPLNVELADEFLEVLDLAEIAVDRGEAHIGDGVERVERIHHLLADLIGGDLGF